MEDHDVEMSEEELQKWIREEVHRRELVSPDVLEKCHLLQSIVERREKQAEALLKLCKSVAACEALVKKQYSLLGWEYRDTESEDDDNITDYGHSPPSSSETVHSETQVCSSSATNEPPTLIQKLQDSDNPKSDNHKNSYASPDDDNITDYGHSPPSSSDSVHSETQVCCSSATNGPTPLLQKLQDSENPKSDNHKNSYTSLMREPVVVLTRLPECKISALLSSTHQNQYTKCESLGSLDSDMPWEPIDNSNEIDSISSFNNGTKKKRKIHEKSKKHAKSGATPQTSTNTRAKSSTAKTSKPQTCKDSRAKSNGAETSTPEANRNTNSNSNAKKTSTPPKSTKEVTPACIVAAHSQSSDATTKKQPACVPQGEVHVYMRVLARRKALNWQQGEIVEILTKDDGKVKYKVNFEEKGKKLVSGHHIAFHCVPKVEQLFIGARVVVKCSADPPKFCPGILAELPSRKNRMRFLVFIDDHTPIYVGLPLLHLVCRPLANPLDDISDDVHKTFMKGYLNIWPYPPHTWYKVGETINAKLNGVLERCEVQMVDSSLIQVVFKRGQQKEWIYRGSIRLEHMINMNKTLEEKKEKGHKKN